MYAFDSSTITLSGGMLELYAGDVRAYGSSTIIFVGSSFMVDGVPVPYGDLTAESGILSGTLASGESLNSGFHQGGYDFGYAQASGTIRLVPEPSSVLLLAFGLVGLAALRKRTDDRVE